MKKVTPAMAKIAVKDEWMTAAMTDDEMVVELLLRLKHAGTVVSDNPAMNLPLFRWGIRRRRSRCSRFGAHVSLKKDVDSGRSSPKNHLSWSGGSGSGGSASISADEFEHTSRQASCSTSTGYGSKIFPTKEITNSFSTRLKKTKLSSELKDKEKLKLKERHDFEKEIASHRTKFYEQNVKNHRLKRIKLDLSSGRVKKETPVELFHKTCRVEAKTNNSKNQESFCFLPDLNMVPSEDDILYGTS